jgi:hypothetical protein
METLSDIGQIRDILELSQILPLLSAASPCTFRCPSV